MIALGTCPRCKNGIKSAAYNGDNVRFVCRCGNQWVEKCSLPALLGQIQKSSLAQLASAGPTTPACTRCGHGDCKGGEVCGHSGGHG